MGSYDLFRNRMDAQGLTQADSYANDTINMINFSFTDSPFFNQLSVDGTTTDVRVIRVDGDPHTKTLTFRPNTIINKGAVVIYNSDNWITTEFEPNELFPTATIKQCNCTLKWEDASSVLQSAPSFVVPINRKIILKNSGNAIEEMDYQTYISCPFNAVTQKIVTGMRFVVGSQIFRVYAVDDTATVYDGHGYITLTLNIDTQRDTDDMINGIADNTLLYREENAVSDGTGNGTVTW